MARQTLGYAVIMHLHLGRYVEQIDPLVRKDAAAFYLSALPDHPDSRAGELIPTDGA